MVKPSIDVLANCFPVKEEASPLIRDLHQIIRQMYHHSVDVLDIVPSKVVDNYNFRNKVNERIALIYTVVALFKWAKAGRIIWTGPALQDILKVYPLWKDLEVKEFFENQADPSGYLFVNNKDFNIEGILFQYCRRELHLHVIIPGKEYNVVYFCLEKELNFKLGKIVDARSPEEKSVISWAFIYMLGYLKSKKNLSYKEDVVQLSKIKHKNKYNNTSLLMSRAARVVTADLKASPTEQDIQQLLDHVYCLVDINPAGCIDFLNNCSAWEFEIASGVIAKYCTREKILVDAVIPYVFGCNIKLAKHLIENLSYNMSMPAVKKCLNLVLNGKNEELAAATRMTFLRRDKDASQS